MKRLNLLAAAVACIVTSAPAMSMPIIVDGGRLKDILDGIAVDGDFNSDVNDDQLVNDGEWMVSGSGGSIGVPISSDGPADEDLRRAPAPSNGNGDITFGIYGWGTIQRQVALLTTNDAIGDPVLFSIKENGSVFLDNEDTGQVFNGNKFGFYITYDGNTWYSDWRRNPNHDVHVGTYAGNGEKIQIGDNAAGFFNPGELIFAFELSPLGGFNDYADFVVLVESIDQVPEPGSLAILGLGLLGMGLLGTGLAGRRRS